jgi:hypothetical protein
LQSDLPPDFRPANPYAARDIQDAALIDRDQLTQLTVVATILLTMAMLSLATGVVSIGFNLALGIGFEAPPNLEGAARTGYVIGQVGAIVIQLAVQIVVIMGAIAMIRRRNIALAWGAVIGSLIPLCGPCAGLSIPAAIWALILLRKPGVQLAFRLETAE